MSSAVPDGRVLTRQEIEEIERRSDLDFLDIQQKRADRVRLRRAVKDRELLLGHIRAMKLTR
jgi:hypothetical protein